MLRSLYTSLREYYHFIRKEMSSASTLPLRIRLRMLRHGFLSQSYTLYDLANRDPNDYISDLTRIRMTRLYSYPTPRTNYAAVLNNKYYSTVVLKQFFDVPEVFAYLDQGRLYPLIASWDNIDLTTFLGHLAERTLRIVVKPNGGAEGGGVLVLDNRDAILRRNGVPTSPEAIMSELSSLNDYLVCEYVQQSEFASTFYPFTTNTIRLVTIHGGERKMPYVALAVQRIGQERSIPVDNWSCGGLSAPIEIQSGTLGTAITHPKNEHMVRRYDNHPDTGAPIKGRVIPRWSEICTSITAAAHRLPFIPLIAWDVVHTDDGTMVIEANGTTGVQIFQAHAPLLRRTDIRAFCEQYGLFNRLPFPRHR